MKNNIFKCIGVLLSATMLIATTPFSIAATDTETNDSEFSVTVSYDSGYTEYSSGLKAIAAGVDLVLLNDEVLIGDNQSIEYGVSVQVSGLYRIGFDYIAQNDSKNPLELALKIDGNTPFEELSKLSLSRLWQSDPKVSSFVERGNDAASCGRSRRNAL